MREVAQGAVAAADVALLLGVSERQVWRLLAAYRRAGAAGLRHGNAGRQPAHTLPPALRERVLALARTTYQGCNHQQLSELLAEREGRRLNWCGALVAKQPWPASAGRIMAWGSG